MARPRSTSLLHAVESSLKEYRARVARGEPENDRVLALTVCIRVEDFFIEKTCAVLKQPDGDTIRAVAKVWAKITGDDL